MIINIIIKHKLEVVKYCLNLLTNPSLIATFVYIVFTMFEQ